MNKQRIVLLVNDTTYAYNLRKELIKRFVRDGHDVTVVCKFLLNKKELEDIGCRLIDIHAERHGTNPVEDIKLFFTYLKILKKEKPDIVLSYNIKPNVYGGMACRILGLRYMPNITGLGTAVEFPGKMQMLTTRLYKWGTYGAECIFFQNTENEQFFKDRKMLSGKTRICLLPGSGVNIDLYKPKAYPQDDRIHFLYVARVMKEKGIDYYLACAKTIWEKYGNVVFHICGMCDDKAYIDILKSAEQEGYIQYHGEQKDMVPFFEMAHCIVHPSYYPEGMSNVLLEAAASARPIIATDRSGCRETVDNQVSGFVVPVKNQNALIEAVDRFMQLSWEEKRNMGLAGRVKMEKEFDREIVVQKYLDEVSKH